METGKIQPQDVKIEAVVIGTLMQRKDALSEVKEVLTPETFYNQFYSDIYKAIVDVDDKGIEPDLLTVLEELRRKGIHVDMEKYYRITESVSFCDIYHYALILKEKQKRRELIQLAYKIEAMAFDESTEFGEILSEIEERHKTITTDNEVNFCNMNDAINAVNEQIKLNNAQSGKITGTPTGFRQFDNRSGGLQKSDLIIIAGDTSQGKTSMAVTIAMNASSQGASIAMHSMEMKKEQIAARMMAMQSGVPANQILYSRLQAEHFEAIDRGITTLRNRKIYFDDRSTSNIDTIISSIRTLKKRYNIDGAIVDYLQILNVNMKGASPEQQMGTVARRLKNLAKELDIWIIALSQLSRDNANPTPSLTRLRDSGQIGEAADVVMLVYRPEIYNRKYSGDFKNVNTSGTALIDVAKGRNIGLLKFIVGFESSTTRFYDVNDIDYIVTSTHSEADPF